ncbi:hypothetical protein [Maribellus mangrovi]|uniref:hypothetical protein n=1 Tax=Maribellus mangrovi TaxID=3133146 RepID=UPI0030EEE856
MNKSVTLFTIILMLFFTPDITHGQGNTLIVTSKEDSGSGTFRQALLDAQNGDTIIFDTFVFLPNTPDTIFLTNPLPALIQGSLIIDASNAGVVIDGSMITLTEFHGLQISSNNNIIRGLHLTNFIGSCIALGGDVQNNIIGGDRKIGTGPSGLGNILTGNGTFGIGMWGENTSNNTIQGNVIGTDVNGTNVTGNFSGGIFLDGVKNNLIAANIVGGYRDHGVHIGGGTEGHNIVRGNFIGTNASVTNKITASDWSCGISIDHSGFNIIGPDNVIANHGKEGIVIRGESSLGNHITKNSIYKNKGLGIALWQNGNRQLPAPILLDFKKQTGNISGIACANCIVEIFSDNEDEGEFYEGQTIADNEGNFSFNKGAPFKSAHITATASDTESNTSAFALFTPDIPERNIILQEGNNNSKITLKTKTSDELEDNRIGTGWELEWIYNIGAKRTRLSLNDIEEERIDWSKSEFEIPEDLDHWASELAAIGVIPHFTLSFWDKANHPDGWKEDAGYSRFQNEEEIQRYLEFVEFIVSHFKDRINYFELWNEPDNGGFPLQHIRVSDYINLVEKVVPVIRQEHPDAKIMVGSTSNLMYSKYWVDGIISSDRIMPLIDVICWHPFYGQSPSDEDTKEYYYNYSSTIQALKDTASAHGFTGEYFADEVGWLQDGQPFTSEPTVSSLIQAAKYYARGIIMHLGLNVTVAGLQIPPHAQPDYSTIRNLCTIMSGNKPDTLEVDIRCEATNIKYFSFSLANNTKLFAV